MVKLIKTFSMTLFLMVLMTAAIGFGTLLFVTFPTYLLVQKLRPDPETTLIIELCVLPLIYIAGFAWTTASKDAKTDDFEGSGAYTFYAGFVIMGIVLGTLAGGFTSGEGASANDSPWIVENRYHPATQEAQNIDSGQIGTLGTTGEWYIIGHSGGHAEFENAAVVGDRMQFYIREDSAGGLTPYETVIVDLTDSNGRLLWHQACQYSPHGDGTPDVDAEDFNLPGIATEARFIRVSLLQ